MSKPLTPTHHVLLYVARFQLIDARQELRKAKAAGRATSALAERVRTLRGKVDEFAAREAAELAADPAAGIFD